MPTFLRRRLTGVRELMEDPDCDPRKLRNTYTQFRAINAMLSGCRRIYEKFLRPMAENGETTVLDIGFGGGDIPRRFAEWAARDGISLVITAIDTEPHAVAYATERHAGSGVRFRLASTTDLLARGDRFDIVLSNHLLHHLEQSEIVRLCDETRRLSRGSVVHRDIVRSDLAYAGFALLTAPFFHRSFIVPDGLTSVRRSFTGEELRRLAPPNWQVENCLLYPQLLRYRGPGKAG